MSIAKLRNVKSAGSCKVGYDLDITNYLAKCKKVATDMESQASKETCLEEGMNSPEERSVNNDNSKRYSFEIS